MAATSNGACVCQQPIELLQTIMEISNVEDFHARDPKHWTRTFAARWQARSRTHWPGWRQILSSGSRLCKAFSAHSDSMSRSDATEGTGATFTIRSPRKKLRCCNDHVPMFEGSSPSRRRRATQKTGAAVEPSDSAIFLQEQPGSRYRGGEAITRHAVRVAFR